MTKKNNINHLLNRISKSDDGCWNWLGHLNASGYSVTSWHGKVKLAYHIFYEHFVGQRDSSLRIDHMCRNRACVNPEHLRQITHKENCRIADHRTNNKQLIKTHCPAGHPYDEQNTYFEKGNRHCKECRRKQAREWQSRNKATMAEKNKTWREKKSLDPVWVEAERLRSRIKMREKRAMIHKLSNQPD